MLATKLLSHLIEVALLGFSVLLWGLFCSYKVFLNLLNQLEAIEAIGSFFFFFRGQKKLFQTHVTCFKEVPVHQILQFVAALESSHLEKYFTISFSYLRYDVGHFRKKKMAQNILI